MTLDFEPSRQDQTRQAPQPPSAFFDGTRLGLEGSMLATLTVAIPAGLHIALSAGLGYAVRYAEGLPDQARSLTVLGFIFTALLAIVAMSMIFFFVGAIPTMAYSMALVAVMLRWLTKVRGHERLVCTIAGGVLGLLMGAAESTVIWLLIGTMPTWEAAVTMLQWPAILTIDAISLIWLTVNILANAGAGIQIGWRLAKLLEQLTMYWFW